MLRTIVAIMVGFGLWLGINVGGGLLLSLGWPAYAAADSTMSYTTGMLVARIVLGVVATLVAGWIAAMIASSHRQAALTLGVVLVLFFIPVHAVLWDKFPVWYHLFFLVALLPLCIAGGRLAGRKRPSVADAAASS